MKKDVLTAILDDYDQKCVLYNEFTEKVKILINDLIKEKGANVHSITYRVKKKDDLQSKLTRSEEKYVKLSDVTDVCGIRIITYFADDVDIIARIIKREFDIDVDNSIDKRALLDPDRFGYLSLHYVAKLTANRLKLTEYQRFSDCKVEIQIRSILQHTWAEIEHDLGYKGKQAVPKEIRRRFSRLAGILELADDEFIHIRDSLEKYEKTIAQQITAAPASVLIDKASLWAFVSKSAIVNKIDNDIGRLVKARIIKKDEWYVERLVNKLHYVGLNTIADVESSLYEYEDTIVAFAKYFFSKTRYEELSSGICLFYLCYILIGSKKDMEYAYNYLKYLELGTADEWEKVSKEIVSTYIKVTTNNK